MTVRSEVNESHNHPVELHVRRPVSPRGTGPSDDPGVGRQRAASGSRSHISDRVRSGRISRFIETTAVISGDKLRPDADDNYNLGQIGWCFIETDRWG